MFQYYEDLKGTELYELHNEEKEAKCEEKVPLELELELSPKRSTRSPLTVIEDGVEVGTEEQTPTLSY